MRVPVTLLLASLFASALSACGASSAERAASPIDVASDDVASDDVASDDVASDDVASGEGPATPPSAPVPFETSELRCVLREDAGRITAMCEEGALSCREALRGDVTEHSGDEVLYRCSAEPDAYFAGLVIATPGAILWTLTAEEVDDMCFVTEIGADLVHAVPDASLGLLVSVRGCIEPGEATDIDRLYHWRDGQMVEVAEERMGCTYLGDTSDPDAEEPPDDASHVCEGAYLRVQEGPEVVRLRAPQQTTGIARDDAGHVVLRDVVTEPRTWDAETGRFSR